MATESVSTAQPGSSSQRTLGVVLTAGAIVATRDAQFLAYNLVWIAVFAAAVLGVRRNVALVSLAVGFCAIGAGIANGVGHVALALARLGYFPGLLTAPLCFAAGVALLRSIWRRGDRA